jgi:hypothetical protein
MHTASKRVGYILPFHRGISQIFNHTPMFEQFMVGFAYQSFPFFPCRDVQPLLCFEESLQRFLLKQIPRITHEDAFMIQDQISQRPLVFNISRSKEDALKLPIGGPRGVQRKLEEQSLRRFSPTSYLFYYSMCICIVVLTYRYIFKVYEMLFVTTAVQVPQAFHQHIGEQSRAVRYLQKTHVVGQPLKTTSVLGGYDKVI